MINLQFRFVLFVALLMLFVSMSCGSALALEVKKVRFGLHETTTRLVLEMDEKVDYQAFVLGDPYRMVIDLPDFSWKAGDVGPQKMAGVLAVRYGNLKPGVSRIVFDLNRAVSIQKVFMLPPGGGKPERMVVDFANVSQSIFAKVKGQSFGTLGRVSSLQDVKKEMRVASSRDLTGGVPKPVRKSSAFKPLVIIDPGHGGVDPGAMSSFFLKEKTVVLALAKTLKAELERSGRYRVKLTRGNDRFIKLRDRVKFARTHEGDLFVSIHADSIEKSKVHGASIYTLSEKASDKQTAKLAAKENRADLIAGIDLSTEDEDVVNILVDLARRDTMNQSKFFASKLVSTLSGSGVSMLESPHRYAGFAVLKAPDIPSILVEAGFMSNDKEARRLNSPQYRKKIARGLRGGIDAYFEQVRKNQRV